MFKDMLKEFLCTYGPTGRETCISNVIRTYVAPNADEIYNDTLGNLIAVKRGTSGKKVMISAHMDQIGLIVTDIDENGFLRVSNVGGVNPIITIAREVVFENGTRGVTYFETEKGGAADATIQKLFIDIGASSRDEAEKKVEIGDIAVYAASFTELGRRISCGALDDRLCCAIVAECFNTCVSEHDVYAVFTVQEEVGLRGAGVAAHSISPDFCVNLDVTLTGDTPKCSPMSVKCGKGPAIKVMDSSVIVPVGVRRFMERCAHESGIPVQNEVLRGGGTDTGAIIKTKGGIPAGCISIATRYIHTPVETADMDDVMNAVKLVNAMLAKKDMPTA